TNDVALLLADKPDEKGRLGSGNIIVVKGTGPPMDISDDVLKIAAEQTRFDFKKALIAFQPNGLKFNSNKIEAYFGGAPWFIRSNVIHELKAQITWGQVFEIMRNVKESGKTNVVIDAGYPYLQKNYRAK